ncbi:hypothetical protein Agub_g9563, partial [Astrephomene gubernaculifera]
ALFPPEIEPVAKRTRGGVGGSAGTAAAAGPKGGPRPPTATCTSPSQREGAGAAAAAAAASTAPAAIDPRFGKVLSQFDASSGWINLPVAMVRGGGVFEGMPDGPQEVSIVEVASGRQWTARLVHKRSNVRLGSLAGLSAKAGDAVVFTRVGAGAFQLQILSGRGGRNHGRVQQLAPGSGEEDNSRLPLAAAAAAPSEQQQQQQPQQQQPQQQQSQQPQQQQHEGPGDTEDAAGTSDPEAHGGTLTAVAAAAAGQGRSARVEQPEGQQRQEEQQLDQQQAEEQLDQQQRQEQQAEEQAEVDLRWVGGETGPAATVLEAESKANEQSEARSADAARPAQLPLCSLSSAHLRGCIPPDVCLPPLQPGELRLCGLTFHPDVAQRVRRRMAEWAAAMSRAAGGEGPGSWEPTSLQVHIPGVDPPTAPGALPTGGGAAAAVAAAFRRHGLRRRVLACHLARYL